jgi:hypothetical protein
MLVELTSDNTKPVARSNKFCGSEAIVCFVGRRKMKKIGFDDSCVTWQMFCYASPVLRLFFFLFQLLLQCSMCQDCYHEECLGPTYPTLPSLTDMSEKWVSCVVRCVVFRGKNRVCQFKPSSHRVYPVSAALPNLTYDVYVIRLDFPATFLLTLALL